MKVLVACEFTGIVRDAFIREGFDATSCDIIPSESSLGPHILGPIQDVKVDEYDLMIAHPPCTHLASSGAWAWKYKDPALQREALEFVRYLLEAPVRYIALENPIGIVSTAIRKPDQIIQPWMFGHGETKATCLWLKNLPKLVPTNVVEGRQENILYMKGPRRDRGKNRSRTYQGIADAMAQQWGTYLRSLNDTERI